MSDIDHEAAKRVCEARLYERMHPSSADANIARAYLDLSAQLEAERERLIEVETENAALRARKEELAEMLRRCVSAGQGVVE
jgi:ATP-dependent Lon protease